MEEQGFQRSILIVQAGGLTPHARQSLQTVSKKFKIEYFKESGFKNVESWRIGKSENWEGTLVVTGNK